MKAINVALFFLLVLIKGFEYNAFLLRQPLMSNSLQNTVPARGSVLMVSRLLSQRSSNSALRKRVREQLQMKKNPNIYFKKDKTDPHGLNSIYMKQIFELRNPTREEERKMFEIFNESMKLLKIKTSLQKSTNPFFNPPPKKKSRKLNRNESDINIQLHFQDKESHPAWAEAANISVIDLRIALKRGYYAERAIIYSMLGFIQAHSKKYAHVKDRTLLVEDGVKGAKHAMHKFNPELGNRFGAFCSFDYRFAISVGYRSRSKILPNMPYAVYQRANRMSQQFRKQHDRKPTPLELARLIGVKYELFLKYSKPGPQFKSGHYMLYGKDRKVGDSTQRNVLTVQSRAEGSDENTKQVLESTMTNSFMKELEKLVDRSLSPEEKKIVEVRNTFNLKPSSNDKHCKNSLVATGKKFNISGEYVRLIEQKAVHKVRTAIQSVGGLRSILDENKSEKSGQPSYNPYSEFEMDADDIDSSAISKYLAVSQDDLEKHGKPIANVFTGDEDGETALHQMQQTTKKRKLTW